MASLQEIRQQYPQYNALSDAELADRLYSKFYSDVPRAQFDRMIGLASARPNAAAHGGRAAVGQERRAFGKLDFVDRNIGVPTGIVKFDPIKGKYGPAPSPITPLSRPLAEGATLGFYDEAEAAGAAVGGKLKQGFGNRTLRDEISGQPNSWEELYNAGLERSRGESAAVQDAHPVVSAALNLVGALAGGGPARLTTMMATPKALTLGQAVKTGAKVGGTYGAVAGFGSSEGGIENRLEGAAAGGAAGAALGAAIPLGVAGASWAWKTGKNALNLGDASERAKNLVLRALERDKVTPEAALAKYQQWQAGGTKPEALMDLGGENMRRLARDAVSVPGESAEAANKFLNERQAGQAERITGDMSKFMPDDSFYGSMDELAASRAESASPLYNEAFRAAGEVWSDDLAKLSSRPSMKKAWGRAKELAREQDRTLPNVFKEDAAEGLENLPGKTPTLEAWDYMKQGLDDILEGYRDKVTGKLVLDKMGRAIEATRKELVTALDKVVNKKVGSPIYATARNQWAGPSQSMDALQLGREVLSRDAEVTSKQLSSMSDGEKYFFRIGVVRAIKDKVDAVRNETQDIVKAVFGSREYNGIRKKLAAAFDSPENFAKFESLLKREAAMFENAVKARGGSRTAEVLAGQKELTAEPGFLESLFDLRFGSAAKQGLKFMARKGQGITQSVSDELARILFDPNAALIESTATGLAKRKAAQAAATAASQGRANLATRAAAGVTGFGVGSRRKRGSK